MSFANESDMTGFQSIDIISYKVYIYIPIIYIYIFIIIYTYDTVWGCHLSGILDMKGL